MKMSTSGENPVIYQNIELLPDTIYFLFIGEIRAYGLNPFLANYLENHYGQTVQFLAIVPDVLAEYAQPNLIVINPESHRWRAQHGISVNCRLPPGQFAQVVCSNDTVRTLVARILRRQSHLFIHTFESRPEMTLPDGHRIQLLGPDPSVAYRLNDKLHQYEIAGKLGIPVPEGRCCQNLEEALEEAETFFRSGEQVFISAPYSAAGSNSIFASRREQIIERFGSSNDPFLVTRRIPHAHDPTVLGVIANEQEVYLASVADQRMDENRFLGSQYPTSLEAGVVQQLKRHTRRIGEYMGGRGYRGIFGCDFIVDEKGGVWFVEVNARKQGTTLETALTMVHRLPGHPTLLDIECHAVIHGKLICGIVEMDNTDSRISWATHNCKARSDVIVSSKLPKGAPEPDLFQRVSGGAVHAEAIVEDHPGPQTYLRSGGFLGRCIAAGNTLVGALHCLERRRGEVERTVIPWSH